MHYIIEIVSALVFYLFLDFYQSYYFVTINVLLDINFFPALDFYLLFLQSTSIFVSPVPTSVLKLISSQHIYALKKSCWIT